MRPKLIVTTEHFRVRNEYCTLISNLTGIPVDDIMGNSHKPDIALARFVLMWALQQLCGYSSILCGRLMSRHHATCLYGKRQINFGRLDQKTKDLIDYLSEYKTRKAVAQIIV